jgi:L-amino acid N-acyltransferase YncA
MTNATRVNPTPSIAVRSVQPVVSRVVLTMLVSASNDPELCQATYLPERLDMSTAAHWVRDRRTRSWVVYLDDLPVGWVEVDAVKDACGLAIPEQSQELEVWLLPHARGRRIFQHVLAVLRPELIAQGVSHLVGVAWVSNYASVQAMRRAGFEMIGDAWWGPENTGGLCTVGVLPLETSRP